MGQQQLLLIILGVIIVGIAIGVGITQFSANSAQANKDGVTSGLMNIAANAYQYKIRPRTMGGGSFSYVNYTIPTRMASDDNGTYSLNGAPSNTQVKLTGISTMNSRWTASCTVDSNGVTMFSYSGW